MDGPIPRASPGRVGRLLRTAVAARHVAAEIAALGGALAEERHLSGAGQLRISAAQGPVGGEELLHLGAEGLVLGAPAQIHRSLPFAQPRLA